MIDALPQLAGRLHPMVLHVPIGLIVGLVLLEIIQAFRGRRVARELRGPVVWLAALTAAVAVGSGLLLAREGDQTATVLRLHKWLGIALASGCLLAALVQPRGGGGVLYRFLIMVTFGVLVAGGHFGATMTHGADFLIEPLRAARSASADESPVGERALPAVFGARCVACHNAERAKGGLSLADLGSALTGGDDGVVIVPGDAVTSELVRRISLPGDSLDHMPPAGKPQLTPKEIALVTAWVNDPGLIIPADAPDGVNAPDERARAPEMPAPASVAALEALTKALIHVEPLGAGSTLLAVDTAAVAPDLDTGRVWELLAPLQGQLADVSIARAGVDDSLVALFVRAPHLRRLNLGDTAITDEGVRSLGAHARLEELILGGTAVTDASIDTLAALPALERLYVWDTAMTEEGVARLRTRKPELIVDDGRGGETEVLEAEGDLVFTRPPPETNTTSLEPVNTMCPVSGAPVDPEYSIVFEGRVIGFCCEKCGAAFWAEPASYTAKLP